MSDNMRDLGNAGLGNVGAPAQKLLDQLETLRSKAPAIEEPTLEPDPTEIRLEEWDERVWKRFRAADLEDFTHSIRQTALAAVAEKKSVVIVGPVGVGKTHLAVAIAKNAFLRSQSVYLTPVIDLLDALRPDGGEAPSLVSPTWVVLDDLGAEKATEWTMERLFMLVNQRWLQEKPTIVTTNLTRPDLEAAVGARTASRLMDDATIILLEGGDRRA